MSESRFITYLTSLKNSRNTSINKTITAKRYTHYALITEKQIEYLPVGTLITHADGKYTAQLNGKTVNVVSRGTFLERTKLVYLTGKKRDKEVNITAANFKKLDENPAPDVNVMMFNEDFVIPKNQYEKKIVSNTLNEFRSALPKKNTLPKKQKKATVQKQSEQILLDKRDSPTDSNLLSPKLGELYSPSAVGINLQTLESENPSSSPATVSTSLSDAIPENKYTDFPLELPPLKDVAFAMTFGSASNSSPKKRKYGEMDNFLDLNNEAMDEWLKYQQ